MNDIALSVALATAPSSAFMELRERPRFWFPLLVMVLSSAFMVYWYYSVVDVEWLKETLFSQNPDIQKLSEEEREKVMGMYGRNTMLVGGVISVVAILPAVFLIQSLYFLVAAKVTGLPQGFKQWFALSCWTALPLLVSTVVSAVLLLLSDTPQISPSVMQPLSLNELVLHRPFGSPGYSLFESLSIPTALSWLLLVIGVRTWSQRSWAFSAIFALLPTVIVYGIWAFIAFR